MPRECVGAIVGRGGAAIKALQLQSGTTIRVASATATNSKEGDRRGAHGDDDDDATDNNEDDDDRIVRIECRKASTEEREAAVTNAITLMEQVVASVMRGRVVMLNHVM